MPYKGYSKKREGKERKRSREGKREQRPIIN
jgi:hypothetical protein